MRLAPLFHVIQKPARISQALVITVLKPAVAAIVRVDDRLRLGRGARVPRRVGSEGGVERAEQGDVGAGGGGFFVEEGLEAGWY